MRTLRLRPSEAGSIPLALLVAIIVAGLVTVLTARIITGERQVRFDRSFTESFHVADAGVQQAVFQLNAGVYDHVVDNWEEGDPETWESPENTTTFGDDTYRWRLRWQVDEPRSWHVISTGTQDGVSRTVQATIEERPLFFPGAFGDTLIAFNGTSTSVDSYNSGSCTTPVEDCEWGTNADYGTGNGAVATNGDFDFSGNTTIRPNSAFLYDWEANRANGITDDDPFGDRCVGTPCTPTHVSTVDEPLDYSSNAQMAFIENALQDCDGSGQDLGEIVFDDDTPTARPDLFDTHGKLKPYDVEDATWDVTDPVDPAFANYYCADSLQFREDTHLSPAATTDHPVVIFVRDFVTVKNQVKVACETTDGSECPNSMPNNSLPPDDVRPKASRLQVYVEADAGSNGVTGSNITYASNSVFGGVVYAPRSRCGGPGGASVDIFGAIICGSMDNVGNWRFHYDDQLGTHGTNVYGVTHYTEEPGLEP